MSELGQGLTISGVGILITFSALGILIGLILLLKALFPFQGKRNTDQKGSGDSATAPNQARENLRKQAAAVGVGVLIKKMDRSDPGSLGALLEDPAASWWRKGLYRVHRKE